MRRHAFTLIELLVVISIIGLLSMVAVVATGSARINARNTQRKADLVQVSKALELYYSDNGVYPSTGGAWYGNCSNFGPYPDTGAGAWIPNFSSYMSQLPHDPNTSKANTNSADSGCRTNGTINCYIYRSNGTDYKLAAYCLPEGTMSASDLFYDPAFSGARANIAWQISTPGGTGW